MTAKLIIIMYSYEFELQLVRLCKPLQWDNKAKSLCFLNDLNSSYQLLPKWQQYDQRSRWRGPVQTLDEPMSPSTLTRDVPSSCQWAASPHGHQSPTPELNNQFLNFILPYLFSLCQEASRFNIKCSMYNIQSVSTMLILFYGEVVCGNYIESRWESHSKARSLCLWDPHSKTGCPVLSSSTNR